MKRILYIMLCTVLATGCSEDFTDLAPISNRNARVSFATSPGVHRGANANASAKVPLFIPENIIGSEQRALHRH